MFYLQQNRIYRMDRVKPIIAGIGKQRNNSWTIIMIQTEVDNQLYIMKAN